MYSDGQNFVVIPSFYNITGRYQHFNLPRPITDIIFTLAIMGNDGHRANYDLFIYSFGF